LGRTSSTTFAASSRTTALDLILSGSSTLTSTLLEHGLADEVLLIVYPVLLGQGKRFFSEGTPPRSFELASTKALSAGIVINAYKVAGP
jgi:dihydrofolate reductase